MKRGILQLAFLVTCTEGKPIGIAEVDTCHLATVKADTIPGRTSALAQTEVTSCELAVLKQYIAEDYFRKIAVVKGHSDIFPFQLITREVYVFEVIFHLTSFAKRRNVVHRLFFMMAAVMMIAGFKRVFQFSILIGLQHIINLSVTASDD